MLPKLQAVQPTEAMPSGIQTKPREAQRSLGLVCGHSLPGRRRAPPVAGLLAESSALVKCIALPQEGCPLYLPVKGDSFLSSDLFQRL